MSLDGLLVDWGGVLTSGPYESLAAFARIEGLAPDAIRRSLKRGGSLHQLFIDLETGSISDSAFEEGCATSLGLATDRADGLRRRMFAAVVANDELRAAVAQIRSAGIRVGLLSNSLGSDGYEEHVFDTLFDVTVISKDVGARKPDPEIYAIAVERIGLPPRQLVFVDDLRANLPPARELGMTTVLHRHNRGTLNALNELFPAAHRG